MFSLMSAANHFKNYLQHISVFDSSEKKKRFGDAEHDYDYRFDICHEVGVNHYNRGDDTEYGCLQPSDPVDRQDFSFGQRVLRYETFIFFQFIVVQFLPSFLL